MRRTFTLALLASAAAYAATLPVIFEPNRGQAPAAAHFLARADGFQALLEPTSVAFHMGASRARLTFAGAKPRGIAAESPSPAIRNYYLGDNPSAWVTGVPTFHRVRYREMLPGVDLVFRAAPDFEFDFELAPGADADLIELRYDGFSRIEIDPAGDLLLETSAGVLRQHAPQVFQGHRRISARYVLRDRAIGIDLGDYDAARPVLIDPRITYLSYHGGSGFDGLGGGATDSAGNYYVANLTDSPNFPRLPAGQPSPGSFDLAVAKFSPTNQLLYLTILGGPAAENAFRLLADADGTLLVAFGTSSTSFPRPAGSVVGAGVTGTGVLRLTSAGALSAVAVLEAPVETGAFGLALDAQRNIWISGRTAGFPGRAGAIQAAPAGGQDIYVARFNSALTAVTYLTYLGSVADELGVRVAADSSGVYVTGANAGASFPTGPSPALPGTGPFVVKIDPSANRILWVRYLGDGSGPNGLALDGASLWVLATSTRTNFTPTADALQSAYGGGDSDAMLVRLNATTGAVEYATWFGGAAGDFGSGLSIDPFGNAVVVGSTGSNNLPLSADALQRQLAGLTDLFLLVADAGGRSLYSSYLGGGGSDFGVDAIADAQGNAILIGLTNSTNLAVAGPPMMAQFGGQFDTLIASLELVAAGDVSLTRAAIQNAASFRGGPVAPGEIVTIYPANAGPPALVGAQLTSERRIATLLAGTRVLFDDVAAPLVYVVRGQISAVVPYDVAGRAFTRIVVEFNGVRSRPVAIPVVAAAPGIFTANGSGSGAAVVVNQDGSLNGPASPAPRGTIVIFFATGEGQTNPPGVNGRLNEFSRLEDFPAPAAPISVTMGGRPADILFGAGAPGFLAGLIQFNVRVPDTVTPGDSVALVVAIGGAASPPGVTIAIR